MSDTDELEDIVRWMRRKGVVRYRSAGGMELELGPLPPRRPRPAAVASPSFPVVRDSDAPPSVGDTELRGSLQAAKMRTLTLAATGRIV
jgi:hypothetical protein